MRLRKVLSRALLVGGVLLLISGIASAQSLTGGCSGSVNGRTAESLTFDDALEVNKGDSVQVNGTAPAGTSGRSSTRVKVGPLSFGPYAGKSGGWGGNVKVPEVIFNFISGKVKVTANARGSGWACKGDGYINIKGEGIGEVIGGALGLTGGAAAAKGAGKPSKKKKENKLGRGLVEDIKDIAKFGKAEGLPADVIAFVIMIFILLIYVFWGGENSVMLLLPMMAMSDTSPGNTVRVTGRPVRGFFGGFFLGLGAFLLLHRFGVVALEWPSMLIPPAGGALVFMIRGLIGEKYVVPGGTAVVDEPPPAAVDDEPPPAPEEEA